VLEVSIDKKKTNKFIQSILFEKKRIKGNRVTKKSKELRKHFAVTYSFAVTIKKQIAIRHMWRGLDFSPTSLKKNNVVEVTCPREI
jgi:hypothetical protein